MKDVLLAYNRSCESTHKNLNVLSHYLKQKGFSITIKPSKDITLKDINTYYHSFVWSGSLYECQKELFFHLLNKETTKITWAENGYFPQSNYFYLDRDGCIIKNSLYNDNLSWISKKHLDKLEVKKQEYWGNRKYNPEYILIITQVEHDTTVQLSGTFTDMQKFINYVSVKEYLRNKNIPIKIRMHPMSLKSFYLPSFCQKDEEKSHINSMSKAIKVIAISSTCLYEASLMGINIEVYGDCLLKKHFQNKEKLLAAILDRDIPNHKEDLDLTYWIQKYSNLEL